jgi:hypothetical protein
MQQQEGRRNVAAVRRRQPFASDGKLPILLMNMAVAGVHHRQDFFPRPGVVDIWGPPA